MSKASIKTLRVVARRIARAAEIRRDQYHRGGTADAGAVYTATLILESLAAAIDQASDELEQ